MKNISFEKISEYATALFIVFLAVGLIVLFSIQMIFTLSFSNVIYLAWAALCILFYVFSNFLKTKNSSEFDFYKEAEPLGRQERRKKTNTEERVAIYIDEDGLDPMIIFDETKSGVACILKLADIALDNKLQDYLSELYVLSEQQGHPIAGQTLMEVHYKGEVGYCRLTDDGDKQSVDFAFMENSELLYEQVYQAINCLLSDFPALSVAKIDVNNYQAMVKFYDYVQRLSAPENRSVKYISYWEGTLKVCNSSYVALYDCTLQSTLTSWISKGGLIRTDNVDVDASENSLLQLMDIDLPYEECRLVDIEIVQMAEDQDGVKLYLTLAELIEGELTENVSGLSLLMKDKSINIKHDETFTDELISVTDYFKQKSSPQF